MNTTERLAALEDIRVVKALYFLHTDRQEWDQLVTLFTPNAQTDFREAVQPHDPSLLMHDVAAFAANNAKVLKGVTTAHFGYMPVISFTGDDAAEGTWSMEDWLWIAQGGLLPAGVMHGWGHYHDRYRRIGDVWKIVATRLTRVRLDFAAA